MKKFYILFILVGLYLNAYPQALGSTAFSSNINDTIYYDKDWKKVDTKQEASFYRIIIQENGLYKKTDYYLNGKIQFKGVYSDSDLKTKEGIIISFDENGDTISYEEYHLDKLHGIEKKSYPNNSKSLWYVREYKNGELHGNFTSYFPNGNLKRKEQYENGKLLNGNCYTLDGKDTTYYPFERMPEFIHGKENVVAMMEFIKNNVSYPKKARRKGVSGTVYVTFVVNDQGKIDDAKVVKGVDPLLDEEALRVINLMPNWAPGQQDGKAVKVKFTVPIKFKLSY